MEGLLAEKYDLLVAIICCCEQPEISKKARVKVIIIFLCINIVNGLINDEDNLELHYVQINRTV
tara:strand:- start:272 stop:463 length:192 start_codon:yes stop_codon:yes gene_type:complete